MKSRKRNTSRTVWLAGWMCWALAGGWIQAAGETRQATGVKVGEVTDTSAIVWMRMTAQAERNEKGECPGAAGVARVRYGTREDLSDALTTEWMDARDDADFTRQFRLTDLKPGTVYFFSAESAGPGGSPEHGSLRGRFETAPAPGARREVTFVVITGQTSKRSLDDPRGHRIYEAMLGLNPKFIVPTGDTVYYDTDTPRAKDVASARFHWARMYSLPRLAAFHLRVPGYWEKDDHDTMCDDCHPSMRNKTNPPLTFEEGRRIFLEQVPMGERTYRTARWGRSLQIWLVEGRDFRSPNDAADGPEKTIWGAEQKAWLKKTLRESDADWRLLISPTPLVGPDRQTKGDNHANAAFAAEGGEMRRWFRENMGGNFFVVCGDRHWQYHSTDPETGVSEFSCGPTTDKHAGGTPGENPAYHRFHRVGGGFLSVTTTPAGEGSALVFRFHDVAGKVVYEHQAERKK